MALLMRLVIVAEVMGSIIGAVAQSVSASKFMRALGAMATKALEAMAVAVAMAMGWRRGWERKQRALGRRWS